MAESKPDDDKPGDAPSAFLKASVKWPDETGDPNVSIAFLLGWRMRRAVVFDDTAAEGENETPGIDDPGQQYDVLSEQIDAALAGLVSAKTPSSFAGRRGTDRKDLERIYGEILSPLYEKDASLGKAACLGYTLHAFCSPDAQAPPAIEAAGPIKLLLVVLATKFPPNAAHSVINSLSLWEEEHRKPSAHVSRERLRAQGVIWRSFLAGETAPKDVLHLTDYVGTADELVRSVRGLFHKSLRQGGSMRSLLVLVIVLALVGVGLLIATGGSTQGVIGAASSLVAAFGLTWKGIGQFFGDAVAKAEQALWDSQVDWTIAYRATLAEGDAGVMARRAARSESHYTLWKQWDKEWPSTPLDREAPVPRLEAGERRAERAGVHGEAEAGPAGRGADPAV